MKKGEGIKVCKIEEIRKLDQKATEEFGITRELLMENAGIAVHNLIQKEFGIKNKKFVVFCGGGDNGGDGLVVARKIHSVGGETIVFLLAEREKYQGSAKKNLEILFKFPIEIHYVSSDENLKSIYEAFPNLKEIVLKADAIIDAIFGTGLTRKVEGIIKK